MSGIEIAGLVLGAFPVALELLKKYKEIGQEYHFWREIRKEFRKCEQDLRYHRLQFQSNLKLLLLPLAIDKQRIEMVLSEPDSDVWSDQDMAQQLERRLGDSFELYMDTVERMNQTMKEMEAALALNSDSVPTQLTEQNTIPKGPRKSFRPKYEYEMYRARFTYTRDKRADLYIELKKLNKRLGKLVQTHDNVVRLEEDRDTEQRVEKSMLGPQARSFWQHADKLHKTLMHSWQCDCNEAPCNCIAKLMLQHRHSSVKIDFRLVFQFQIMESTIPAQVWQLREARVEARINLSKRGNETVQVITSTSCASIPNHRSAAPPQSVLRLTSGKRRAYEKKGNDHVLLPRVQTSQVAALQVAAGSIAQVSNEQAVRSLCQFFSGHCSLSDSGVVEHDDTRYYFFPGTHHSSLNITEPVTLLDILDGTFRPRPSRRQRCFLALTLASSFLQLQGSAWMRSTLGKSDISFLRDSNNPNILLLEKPCITKGFNRQNVPADAESSVGDLINTLGITILELWSGDPIEASAEWQQYANSDNNLNAICPRLVAMKKVEDLEEEAGSHYAKAVKWCFYGIRSLPVGQDWRQDFCKEVIAPLELVHKHMGPATAIIELIF